MNRPAQIERRIRRFPDAALAVEVLADEIVARLSEGVGKRGSASLVASGGTTPRALYDVLSTRDARWNDVSVTLTDERWVSAEDDRSNEKLVRSRLLRNRASAAPFVPLLTKHPTAIEAEPELDSAIAAMPRPFDVTLLGMGADGHIASLFPGAKELTSALDPSLPALVRAINPQDIARAGPRMSLTLRAILASRLIVILICGDEKMDAYRAAIAGGDVESMPVRAVLWQTDTPVEIYWAP